MTNTTVTEATAIEKSDFIRQIINQDLESGHFKGTVKTRFPPEPNGYLHVGHVKAICINFDIAETYQGQCNLRFDDTNPVKEETEFAESMKEDIHWLGFEWANLLYASDYFEQLYQWAVALIKAGKAYVDDLSAAEIRAYRGTLTEPGRNSPYRNRSVEENLDLFERMRQGEFPDGTRVLRAKIDMASPNMNLRDPVMYRILHAEHHRTGDAWCIYPMYDWAHGQSDSIEGITYSLCSLEFENHRPLYDWFVEQLNIHHPRQIEFARLNVSHTITSKRKLRKLVEEGYVRGWDDPRMPTIRGMRRRGYTARALRNFCDRIGVAKANSVVDMAMLEHAVREDLNTITPRAMAVIRPLRVVIENYPEGQVEEVEVPLYPQDKSRTETRLVPFSRELYIDRSDFMEEAPRKYYRLTPGREVRFIKAYYITCNEVIKDEQGEVIELRCTYDPDSKGGTTADGRKVKGTIHWLSATQAVPTEVRLYDTLFAVENPANIPEGEDITYNLNPNSLEVITDAYVEPLLAEASPGSQYQFMRTGYFAVDPDSTAAKLVFNRTITLRDTWAKVNTNKK